MNTSNRSYTVSIAASILLLLFILLPLISTITATKPDELSRALTDPVVLHSLWITFLSAGIATAIGLVFGLPLAYLLARNRLPFPALIESIINLPVVIPHTAAGIALLMVFGRKGLLGQYFGQVGLYFTDNLAGVTIAMLFVSLPFLINTAQESFALIDPEMESVAYTEGATPWQAFFYVTLPQAWRGVLSGALMMWSRGVSEFGAVVILAYHPKIVPVLIYEWFEGFGLVAARPVAVLLILAVLVVFILLRLLLAQKGKQANSTTTR